MEAARLAEHNNVQYCNFTLRPMSYETSKVEAGKLKVSSVKLYNNSLAIDKAYYMEVNSLRDYFGEFLLLFFLQLKTGLLFSF